MAKFKVKAKAEDAAKAGQDTGEFVVPPAGYYHLKIVEANAGYSKTDGEEDKSKPRIEIVYEIHAVGMDGGHEPEDNYGRIWDYVTFGDGYAATRRTEFTEAVHPGAKETIENGGEVELDTDELLERIVIARLKHEKDKQKSEEEKKTVMRARVATVLPLSAAEGATDDGGPVDFGGDDEEGEAVDEDPFGEEPEEEEGEEESDLLTAEELEAMEPKELSAVAKEFDLDPNDLIVKFKSGEKKGKVNVAASKKAMVEAILEAQGGDEESEEDGDVEDDDSPF